MPQDRNSLKWGCLHQATRQATAHDEFAPLSDPLERDTMQGYGRSCKAQRKLPEASKSGMHTVRAGALSDGGSKMGRSAPARAGKQVMGWPADLDRKRPSGSTVTRGALGVGSRAGTES